MAKVKRIYKLGCDANGNDVTEGFATDSYILGSKGANLAEMARIGLPVPPGFTITCQTCMDYLNAGNAWPKDVMDLIENARHDLEMRTGKRLGDAENPLLVSVRSSAPISMSGVMDTVLNLGLNDKAISGLIAQTKDPRYAWDSYCRFIQMFSVYVMGFDKDLFENTMMTLKIQKGVKYANELDPDDLETLAKHFKQIFSDNVNPNQYPQLQIVDGKAQFPQDPDVQLVLAIQAVFDSWNSQRAICYRQQNRISDDLGVAVNIMSMVYGNRGDTSATGVAFTRNPANGAKESYGDYLVNAQGEDVVVGIRTAEPIENLKVTPALKEAGEQLDRVFDVLEHHYRDMMDVEFTIEEGKLYLLQTRVSKRTATAALKVALDMVDEGLISKEEALLRIDPKQIDQLLHPQLDTSGKYDILCKGFNASAGVATGGIVFSSDDAIAAAQAGKDVILVRWETNPDDLKGMIAAQGILTSHGGKTSHAAVVSRGMGLPCVCGVESLRIDVVKKQLTIVGTDVVLHEGDVISLDGSTGDVVNGAVKLTNATLSTELKTLLTWADKVRKIGVRANVDNLDDAKLSLDFGADGIVLNLNEPMFLDEHNHECTLQESFVLQSRAITHVTARLLKEGFNPHPLIMIPLTAFDTGYKAVRKSLETTIAQVEQQNDVKLPKIPIGAMIDLSNSAVDPEQIAKYADFCCFDTRDLTQSPTGCSCDDAEDKDTLGHLNRNIDTANPLETLDKDTIGFIESISKKLREINSTIELGIYDAQSPELIQKVCDLAMDYVICSPYRVPIVRLAAAQATLRSDSK